MELLTFWLPVAAMTVIVAGLAWLGVTRGAQAMARAQEDRRDLKVYADQLREIERDLARGVIAADEAERLKTETARRLLDADRAHGRRGETAAGMAPPGMRGLALAMIPAAVVLAAGVYAWRGVPLYSDQPLVNRHAEAAALRAERPAQAELEAAWLEAPEREALPEPDGEFAALMERLRETLAERPDDLTGLRLLAQNEARLGRFAEAAAAQRRVVSLLPEGTPRADGLGELVRLAQFQIAAAGGVVSPETDQVLETILRIDPQNGFARFFVGVMFDQTGRPDRTFHMWRRLLEDSQPDDPWIEDLRDNLPLLAQVAGVHRYQLPPRAAIGQRGPSPEMIAAAEEMDAADRGAMIGEMVEGLAARLATGGGPAEDWARLIQSLAVLGQNDRARTIWAEARSVFAADREGMALIDEAAAEGGLSGDAPGRDGAGAGAGESTPYPGPYPGGQD